MATNEQVEAAILKALEPTGEELVRWKVIESRLPGTWEQKAEAYTQLYYDGRIVAMKIRGTPYVPRDSRWIA